ncbi:MAG TPA: hypothetical protein VLU46_10760 [Thermoanaerobaculia bacterium]|nr:hypothetical protein [Thermoanaerobaculia bacterium]
MRRLTAIAVALLIATAAVWYLVRFYTRRFDNYTGNAKWIWASAQLSRNEPVVFFAAREFALPDTRAYTHVKIFADPQYTLYFNGIEIAGRRVYESRDLDVYDVSKIAVTGRNRIVVAVRSTNGVGGLLASVDIAPEFDNFVISDTSWKIFRHWNDALPSVDVGDAERPMVVGQPPEGRWDFLQPVPAKFDPPAQRVIEPKEAVGFKGAVPTVRIVEGVAVATSQPERATAFDFGFIAGRVRLTLLRGEVVPPVVRFRYANVADEFRTTEAQIWSTPFAAGERSLTEPESHHFRYVIVFGGRARAEVVQ